MQIKLTFIPGLELNQNVSWDIWKSDSQIEAVCETDS